MENMNNADTFAGNELKVMYPANEYLATAAKWAKLLAILSWSIMGLAILLVLIAVMALPYMGMGISMVFIYIVIFAIASIPIYFLFRFSTQMLEALSSKDNNILTESLGSLKSYFFIQGIFMIISVVMMIVSVIAMFILMGTIGNSLHGIM